MTTQTYPFSLPPLPYAPDALEPHFDARTMSIHHDEHHRVYVERLNAALKDHPGLHGRTIENLLRNLNRIRRTFGPRCGTTVVGISITRCSGASSRRLASTGPRVSCSTR